MRVRILVWVAGSLLIAVLLKVFLEDDSARPRGAAPSESRGDTELDKMYAITSEAPDIVIREHPVQVAASHVVVEAIGASLGSSTFNVTVQTAGGSPVNAAAIAVSIDSSPFRVVYTGVSGRASFSIPAGEFVSVSHVLIRDADRSWSIPSLRQKVLPRAGVVEEWVIIARPVDLRLSGVAVDAAGLNLEGVVVEAQGVGEVCVSDSDGRWSMSTAAPGGSVQLNYSWSGGRCLFRGSVTVVAPFGLEGSEECSGIRLEVPRCGYAISLTVKDAAGRPVDKCRVVHQNSGEHYGFTDSEGVWSADLPYGQSLAVEVVADGYLPARLVLSGSGVLADGGVRDEREVVVQRQEVMRGRLVGRNGQAVPLERVSFGRIEQGGIEEGVAYSDELGMFDFYGDILGSPVLLWKSEGGALLGESLFFPGSAEAVLRLWPVEPLHGIVLDRAGAPIVGARVTARDATGRGIQRCYAITDSSGEYALEVRSGGMFHLSAGCEGFVGEQVRLAAGARHDFNLGAVGGVRCTVPVHSGVSQAVGVVVLDAGGSAVAKRLFVVEGGEFRIPLGGAKLGEAFEVEMTWVDGFVARKKCILEEISW